MDVTLPPLTWRPSPNASSRHGTRVDLVVVHRPVGSYESACDVLCEPSHQASAHTVLGRPRSTGGPKLRSLEVTQLVRWGDKAWACVSFNSRSDNLEICDEAWDGRDPDALRVAARIVAFRLHKRALPARWVRDPARDYRGGFTRHYDLGSAGGGHSDPTTSTVRWLRFVWMVKQEARRGNFRRSWGLN